MQPLQAGDPVRVGPYGTLARLGAGGMGVVLLARSPGGRLVALKLVRSDFAANPGFRERFRREAAAARRVGGPYTAPVLDADPDAERPWLAVGYVAAPTLGEAVARFGPLPEPALRALGAGLAEALLAIHGAGLVHRDLKPGNVLLAEDGPKVIDFGVAKAADAATLTETGGLVGTPAFMSPEQIDSGRGVGPASDVFSLASVLVYAASGVGPFVAADSGSLLYRVLYEEPRTDGVPAPLHGLLSACLAKEPSGRPSVQAVLDALTPADPAALASPALRQEVAAREAAAAAVAGGPVVPPPPLPRIDGAEEGRPERRLVLRLGVAAAVAAVGAGGGATAWALTRDKPKPVRPAPRATGLVAAPAPAWSLVWPAELADGLPLAVAVAGGTVVWRGGSGLCGVDAASGRRLWTFDHPVGSTFNEGYRVHGGTVYAVAARPAKTVYAIDPRTGAARSIDLPGDMTSLTDTYGTSGTTLFVGASTGDEATVLAVDLADGRVRWRFPTGARSVRGTADAGAVYLCTPTQIIAIDAATGRRRWTHGWSADESRSTGYPLTLGDGLLFFGATGSSLVRAVRTGDGAVAWSKPARDVQRPVAAPGPTLATVGTKGFHVYDQATGALRWQQLSSPADLDFLGGTKTIGGSDRLLAAAFADTERDSGFFAAPTGGGPPWAHRGESQERGWRLAVSGPAVYATDNQRLHCFRAGA